MCGIVGGISVHPLACLDESARIDRAIDCLAHRGPDDRGLYVSADRRAFLGHRRLSIIDLAGGHQPLVDATGRVRMVYNGEIYNYRQLRAEAADYPFKTRSDGEVVLPLYREDSGDFMRRLSGMFAIAVLDEIDGRLTLVRDRNGIKPLYYWSDGATLFFASELKALLPLLPARPALSSAGLRAFLRWKYIPDPLTIFAGVSRLPPATVLYVDRPRLPDVTPGRLSLDHETYWRPDYSVPPITDEAAALDELDARLNAAVRSHLESDVDVGTLLSGGVDSSLVTALAARLSDRRIKTFSVGFREAGFDQLPYARQMAERYHTDHHEELVELDPIATIERMTRHFDEPFADSSALACLRVCEVAARHVKVVLTGDGGDESFAGYKRYEDLLLGAGRSAWTSVLCRAAAFLPGLLFSPEAKFVRRLHIDALPPAAQHVERQALCGRWLTHRLLGERYRPEPERDVFGDHLELARCLHIDGDMNRAQFADLRVYLPGDILTKVDRTSMACSLECRVPLLDHSITEFSAALAVDLKIRGGVRKYLLKRLAERYVPRDLLYRPKMGFRIPIRRWFKRDLLDRAATELLNGEAIRAGLLDSAGVAWMLHAQRRPWIDFGSQLWALLALEYWARAYLPR